MLYHLRAFIVAGLSLLSLNTVSQNYRLEKAWETEPVFSTPESAVFDARRDQIYISNFNKFPRDLESADDFISVLDLDGNILKLKWITGLKAPTGITIYADQLFVVERDGVGIYHIESGELVEKKKIDLETKEVVNVARLDTGIIDGIKHYKNDYYIVTLWEGRIYLIHPRGTVNELLDIRSSNIKTADIEFIPELNLLIIPTFSHSRVIAYRIEE